MKTTTLLIAACLLTGAGIAVAAFTYKAPVTTEVAVLSDVTEKQFAPVNASDVLGLYGLSGENEWNGAGFQFSDITDVSFNPTQETHIEAVNKWLSNELDRDKQVKAFGDTVSGIIFGAATNTTVGRLHSSVYLALAHQLTSLSQSTAQKRILLVYSDLMENDPTFSLYDKRELTLMQTNPGTVQQIFNGWQPLPSLTGIEIHLIYQPANTEADAQYRIVSGFYQNLLQQKGATVLVEANLSH